jgi:hypothetical protein
MRDYRYVLVRYVADRLRMEPINVGVILQGAGRVDIRFSPHAAKRKDIDTATLQQWRQFFVEEVKGDPTPLFHPEKESAAYLQYLAQLCEGAIHLSTPLQYATIESSAFDEVLESLYQRLVAPPEQATTAEVNRATSRFRQISKERDFDRRGMRRHAHVKISGKPLWMAYRQVDNGELIAIDKIEVDNRIGSTASEIQQLPRIIEFLPDFLRTGSNPKPTRFVLLADPLEKPFTDQSPEEFEAMQRDLDEMVGRVERGGGRVLRSLPEAEKLADEIDQKLEQHLTPLADA